MVLIFIQGFCLLYKHESKIHLHFYREIISHYRWFFFWFFLHNGFVVDYQTHCKVNNTNNFLTIYVKNS